MTVREAAALIGKVGLLTESRGLRFEVSVLDVKQVYGATRYLVSPIVSCDLVVPVNSAWVDAGQVTGV